MSKKNSIKEEIRIETIKKNSNDKLDSNSSCTTSTIDVNFGGYISTLEWTEAEEKRVLRIIDTRLMPYVLLMFFVLNMDRTNISNAISDNLPADLGFDIDGVNTAIAVYYAVFSTVTLITGPIAKRVGAHIWIPFIMSAWAIITWAHSLVHNFNGYLVVRFFIALTEAGFIPTCLIYLNSWYKSNELATRLTWFWGSQAVAGAFSGLISFGVFRLAGVGGLAGWRWLFLLDGIFTHIVGFIAIFYIPAGPFYTKGSLRGKKGWFDDHQASIAVTRLIRDDKYKSSQHKEAFQWHDLKITLLDTRLWTHFLINFAGVMPTIPLSNYLPTLIKGYGFSVTTSNLLTIPSFMINLVASILIARSADKRGYYAYHILLCVLWSIAAFLALELLPADAGRWSSYAAAMFATSVPTWNGMHVAWMSVNCAPNGKRTLALGAIIAAANLSGAAGSHIYQQSDAPRFYKGNKINLGIAVATFALVIFQHTRYVLTNKMREKKLNHMSDNEKAAYELDTKDEGSNRLDYKFRI